MRPTRLLDNASLRNKFLFLSAGSQETAGNDGATRCTLPTADFPALHWTTLESLVHLHRSRGTEIRRPTGSQRILNNKKLENLCRARSCLPKPFFVLWIYLLLLKCLLNGPVCGVRHFKQLNVCLCYLEHEHASTIARWLKAEVICAKPLRVLMRVWE